MIEEGKNDDFYKIIEKNLLEKINDNIHLSNEYQGVMFALRRLEKIADRALSIAYLMHYAKIGGEINRVKL
jgi:phosphate transport system protein